MIRDPAKRLRALALRLEPRFRRRFLEAIARIKAGSRIRRLERLLVEGRVNEAVLEAESAVTSIGAEWLAIFMLAGLDTADFLSAKLKIVVGFDPTSSAAQNVARQAVARATALSTEQQVTARSIIQEGLRTGAAPRQIAQQVSAIIGLSPTQVSAVQNYRRLLQQGSAEALARELRDRSFDPVLRASIQNQVPLTPLQIRQMVGNYAQRQLLHRANVIAQMEVQDAVGAASEETYRQAIAAGQVNPGDVYRIWETQLDSKVRDSHGFMHGQTRLLGLPFRSGNGNLLQYPGDSRAPIEDTINCRCFLTTAIVQNPEEAASLFETGGVLLAQ